MWQLKAIATGDLHDCSIRPRWVGGIWECGAFRITDSIGTEYEVVGDEYAPMTPMEFYLAFTPAERIAIKASADPMVKEFWETYELAVRSNASIDPNLVSVKDSLAYLAQPAAADPPGPGILPSFDRIAQILAGTPQ